MLDDIVLPLYIPPTLLQQVVFESDVNFAEELM